MRKRPSEIAEKVMVGVLCILGIPIVAIGLVVELATKSVERLIPGSFKLNRGRRVHPFGYH